ncbi:MAG: undecaprenyl/decaprenyl-phosphate alpha-N-acetylglucosaminyl 1-phosphate transferase [Phycisphaerales bacterium]|nr:undecaprenyl/decaprenyl-phosphate alpha-N-acetylglucosaminyl 1-phosphate transferase [Phycisphaerales bacterium]
MMQDSFLNQGLQIANKQTDISTWTVLHPVEILSGYMPVFVAALVATLIATPIVRRVAVAADIIDHPDHERKQHAYPIAYLGGLAIFFGVLVGIAASAIFSSGQVAALQGVPASVVVGMMAIVFTGLADDIWKWDPRLKIAGQLVAAAALAIEDVGPQLAAGVLSAMCGEPNDILFSIGAFHVPNAELYYWIGTAITAIFVIGGCNAANLIDGLDGLLTGTATIMAVGFLAISLLMAYALPVENPETSLAGTRIILSLILLGTTLGFLPYNFNPAVIFLGDCGSLLIGFLSVVIIMTFGELGTTKYSVAGLICFGLPILDTTLAIIRRKVAGLSMSDADSNHIHHRLKRYFGGSVRKSVLTLYSIAAGFTIIGVGMTAILLLTTVKGIVVESGFLAAYLLVVVFALKRGLRLEWIKKERAKNPELREVLAQKQNKS